MRPVNKPKNRGIRIKANGIKILKLSSNVNEYVIQTYVNYIVLFSTTIIVEGLLSSQKNVSFLDGCLMVFGMIF